MSSYTIMFENEGGKKELAVIEAASPKDAVISLTGSGDMTGVVGIVEGAFDVVEDFLNELEHETRRNEILAEDSMWDEV